MSVMLGVFCSFDYVMIELSVECYDAAPIRRSVIIKHIRSVC